MHIQVFAHDGVPLYRQIVNQVKYLIASGQLAPGDELPPIRTLAKQLVVTPNTVVKAYDELKSQGVIHMRQGSGTYVSELVSPLVKREKRRLLAERADSLLTEAQHMGVPYEDVLSILEDRRVALIRAQGQDNDAERAL